MKLSVQEDKIIKKSEISSAHIHYRISGHESFSFRYAWFPKVVRLLNKDKMAFSDDDKAMVELGLGKNMVRSARFWAQTAGVISSSKDNNLTDFANIVLENNGVDPYLEDIKTLWLLHWNLSTDVYAPLLAWNYLFSLWQEPEIVSGIFCKKLVAEAARQDKNISNTTVEQHVSVFLHTYVPTKGVKGRIAEDNLDCPLVELQLLHKTGERTTGTEREPIYALRHDDNADITTELFAYCVADYWQKQFFHEQTLSFKDIAYGHGSPGRVLALTEDAVRIRLERIADASMGCFEYIESAHIQQLRKTDRPSSSVKLLKNVYSRKGAYA